MNSDALLTMSGSMPNLEILKIDHMSNVTLMYFNTFIASYLNLKNVKIAERSLIRFGLESSDELFQLMHLQPLKIDRFTRSDELHLAGTNFMINDGFFIYRTYISFPNLTILKLTFVDLIVNCLGLLEYLQIVQFERTTRLLGNCDP